MFNFECFAVLKWDISRLFIFFLSFQNDPHVDRKLNMDMCIILLFKP